MENADRKHRATKRSTPLQFGLPLLFLVMTLAAVGVAIPNAYRIGFLIWACGCFGIALIRIGRIMLARPSR